MFGGFKKGFLSGSGGLGGGSDQKKSKPIPTPSGAKFSSSSKDGFVDSDAKKQKVGSDSVTIVIDGKDKSAQQLIGAFARSRRSKEVKKLVIRTENFCEQKFKLEISMPNLEELKICARVGKLVLSNSLTPKLRKLHVDTCAITSAHDVELDVTCAQLTHIFLKHVKPLQPERRPAQVDLGHQCPLQEMIHETDVLISFDSYKLWFNGGLAFFGDHLEHIKLHRAEGLTRFIVQSPRIKTINCQGCWSMEEFAFPESPFGPRMDPSNVHINLYNCNALPENQITALKHDPRVKEVKTGEPFSGDPLTAMENSAASREKYMRESGADTSTLQGMMEAMQGWMQHSAVEQGMVIPDGKGNVRMNPDFGKDFRPWMPGDTFGGSDEDEDEDDEMDSQDDFS